ncbi:hypothetical protein ASG62_07835 [Aureimonas sp. Leaf427]|nr:hypothetical protein ASG62_07835 [Aureimonas sp. Leaf427]
MQLVVEPRLADPRAWYIVADPAVHDGAEYSLLSGNEQPFTDSRSGFDVDGVEFKMRHDFGAGWTDYRSWYTNPGA